jgi:branched-chain amino acid transport system permease protein
VVGAVAFTWLQDVIIRSTDYWRAVLGVVILALVLAFPQGLAGALGPLVERILRRPATARSTAAGKGPVA